MGEAVVAVAGVIVAGALGALGGFLTARQQGRSALELERLRIANEQQRQRTKIAIEIARLDLERDPHNPHAAAEHVAVLMALLAGLEGQLYGVAGTVESGTSPGLDEFMAPVEQFMRLHCLHCGGDHPSGICRPGGSRCSECGGRGWIRAPVPDASKDH